MRWKSHVDNLNFGFTHKPDKTTIKRKLCKIRASIGQIEPIFFCWIHNVMILNPYKDGLQLTLCLFIIIFLLNYWLPSKSLHTFCNE